MGILDQLLRLIHDPNPPPFKMAQLRLSTDDEARLSRLKAGVQGRFVFNQAANLDEVVKILSIYPQILERLKDAPKPFGSPPRDFGPLSLGLQVKGKIGLRHASDVGILLDPDDRSAVLENLAAKYQSAYLGLKKCSSPRADWLESWPDSLPTEFKERRLPSHHALSEWLEQRARSIVDRNQVALPVPRDVNGRLEMLPEFWEDHAWCDALLRHWSDLVTCRRLACALSDKKNTGGRLTPLYAVIPRVRSINPDLSEIRRLAKPNRFRPRSDRSFVVCHIKALETQCFAAVVRCWEFSGTEEEGVPFRRKLFEHAAEHLAHVEFQPRHRSQPRRPIGRRHSEYGIEDIDTAIPGSLEKRITHQIPIVATFFWAVSRGLSETQARTRLNLEYQRDFTPARIQKDWNRLVVGGGCEDFHNHTADAALRVVARRLNCDFQTLLNLVAEQDRRGAESRIRKAISGGTRDTRLLNGFLAICRNSETRAKLTDSPHGSRSLYDQFFKEPRYGFDGSIRVVPCATNGVLGGDLVLAAGVLKLIAYELARAGLDPVATAGEEIVVESPRDRAENDRVRVEEIANRVLDELLEDYAPDCEVRLSESW